MAKRPPKDIGKAIQQGYIPMFMTSKEIAKHANLSDAGYWGQTKLGQKKTTEQKKDEEALLAHKLDESKTGPEYDSRDLALPNEKTLYNSIKEKGLTVPFPIAYKHEGYDNEVTPNDSINLSQGHHRLAVTRHLNPNQFHALEWAQVNRFGRRV